MSRPPGRFVTVSPRRAAAFAISLAGHAGLLVALFFARPAPLALEPPTPIEVRLAAAPVLWPGAGDGGEAGRRGGLAPVPRAARPSPIRKVKREPPAREPTRRPPEQPSEAPPDDQPPAGGADEATISPGPGDSDGVAGGGGAPGSGTGTEGSGAGGGSFFDRHPNFRWVWKLDRGRYRVFVPPGYTLQIRFEFESTLDNHLDVTTVDGRPVATFDKRGPTQWSYRNDAGMRALVFRGADRHDCRYAQVGLRARIGFEDRTDQDCDEPAVLLRLVRQ